LGPEISLLAAGSPAIQVIYSMTGILAVAMLLSAWCMSQQNKWMRVLKLSDSHQLDWQPTSTIPQ